MCHWWLVIGQYSPWRGGGGGGGIRLRAVEGDADAQRDDGGGSEGECPREEAGGGCVARGRMATAGAVPPVRRGLQLLHPRHHRQRS